MPIIAIIVALAAMVGLIVWLVVEIRMDRKTQERYRVTTPRPRDRLPPHP